MRRAAPSAAVLAATAACAIGHRVPVASDVSQRGGEVAPGVEEGPVTIEVVEP